MTKPKQQPDSGFKFETRNITDVIANDWNPNSMREEVYEAEIESILAHGFIVPVTVRTLADDSLEIVDGEHRCKAMSEIILKAREGEIKIASADKYSKGKDGRIKNAAGKLLPLGTGVPWLQDIVDTGNIPVVNLGHVSEVDAKKLTVILNETRGEVSSVRLAELLESIKAEAGDEYLAYGLPYQEAEMESILNLVGKGWEGESGEVEVDLDNDEGEEWVEFRAIVPMAVHALIEEAKKRIHDNGVVIIGANDKSENGQILELLVAEFLSVPSENTE